LPPEKPMLRTGHQPSPDHAPRHSRRSELDAALACRVVAVDLRGALDFSARG
jgi:hypothetical protein